MKNILKAICLITGLVLILNGLICIVISSINFGIIASILMGIFAFLVFLLFEKIEELIKTTIKGKVLFVFFAICLMFFIFTESVIIFSKVKLCNEEPNIIIVLGAGLKGDKISLTLYYRLLKGLEYLEKNPDAYIVVTGGMGAGETITEAEAMKAFLIRNGVSEEKIIYEDESTSTTENFKFTKKLLDEKFEGEEYDVCYTTNSFHVYRAGKIAERQGLIAYGIPARDVWYMSLTNHIREFFAVVKWWAFRY